MGERAYFTVNGNDFPFDLIFHAQPNTQQGVNCFPESIFNQNKHSLEGLREPSPPTILFSSSRAVKSMLKRNVD